VQALGELEAKFTKINNWYFGEFFWIRRKVPWLNKMLAQLNHLDVFHTGDDVVMTTVVYHTASGS
jgi:hypothetical protein